MPLLDGLGVTPATTEYPLVAPSADVLGRIADFFLLHEYDAAVPLRITLLVGFGGEGPSSSATPSSSLGSPVPGGGPRVVVEDAHGAVVFDSVDAGVEYAGRPFSSAYFVHQWSGPGGECRLVQRLSEPFPDKLVPAAAVLDERAHARTPVRLRSLTVDGVKLTGRIKFEAGYNVTLAVAPEAPLGTVTAPRTVRNRTKVEIGGAAGSGAGRFDGCGGTGPRILKTVNGQGPDATGNLALTAGGCYWVRPPSELTPTPRILPNTLQVGNDCGPCCDCQDYVNTYRAVAAANARSLSVGASAEQVRDTYRRLKERWLASLDCRVANPVQVVLASPATGCLVVVAQVGNTTPGCLPMALKIRVQADGNGLIPLPGACYQSDFRTEQWVNIGVGVPGGSVGGSDNPNDATYTISFEAVDPGHAGRVRLTFLGQPVTTAQVDVTGVGGGADLPGTVSKTIAILQTSTGACNVA